MPNEEAAIDSPVPEAQTADASAPEATAEAQPPVDNESVAEGATPFTDAEVAANAPTTNSEAPVDDIPADEVVEVGEDGIPEVLANAGEPQRVASPLSLEQYFRAKLSEQPRGAFQVLADKTEAGDLVMQIYFQVGGEEPIFTFEVIGDLTKNTTKLPA